MERFEQREKKREVLKLGGWSSACFFLCPPSRLQRSCFAPLALTLCAFGTRALLFCSLALTLCAFDAQTLSLWRSAFVQARCPQDISKICPRYNQGLPKICPRFWGKQPNFYGLLFRSPPILFGYYVFGALRAQTSN